MFPLAPIRPLKPVEVSAVFDADVNAGISGMLYRLRVPAAQRFLQRTRCAEDEDTQWMATYVTGHTLEVAFFSGDDMPVFTFDAISKSTAFVRDVCVRRDSLQRQPVARSYAQRAGFAVAGFP